MLNERPTPDTEELKCLSLIEVMAIPQERREIALGTLRAIKERNEAMDYSKATWQSLRDSQDEVLRLTFENRELSQSIEGWENKWKCAIDMAARAELERDEALKDAKNYHAKMVNLINEREDARELAQQMSESNQVLQAEVRDYRKKEKLKP